MAQLEAMKSSEECRSYAEVCRRFAYQATEPKVRARWLVIAKAWERTAAEVAAATQLSHSVASYEENAATR